MPRRWTHRLEAAFCFAVVAAVPCLFFAPVLTAGLWPWSPAPLYEQAPWEEADDGSAPGPLDFDQTFVHRYLPWYAFLAASNAAGESVLWNPYEGGGAPFFAGWETRCLSPFSLPLYVLPLETALPISVLAKAIAAGLTALLAARYFGLVWPAALLTAVAFQTAPILVMANAMPVSDAVPWLPLAFAAMDYVKYARLTGAAAFAAALSLMLLGGAPGTAVFALAVALCYWTLTAVRAGALAAGAGWLAAGLASAAMACGLAAVQLLPAAERIALTAPPGPETVFPRLDLAAITAIMLPPAPSLAAVSYLPALLYSGVVGLALLPLWVAVRRFVPPRQRLTFEPLAVSMIAAAAIWGVAYTLVPPSRITAFATPEHIAGGFPFLIALLAAAAIQEWSALDAQETRYALKRLALFLPLAAAVFAGALFFPGAAERGAALGFDALLVLGPFAAALLFLAWTLLRPSIRNLGYGLTIVAAVTSYMAYRPVQRFADPEAFLPETAFLSTLAERDARVSGTQALREWPLSMAGIAQLYNPTGIETARQRWFIEAAAKDPLLIRRSGSQALLLTREDIRNAFAAVRPDLRIERVFESGAVLFNDLAMTSRARMAYEARPIDGPEPELLDAAAPPLAENPVAPPAGDGPAAVPSIGDAESHTRIDIAVPNTRPGILVVSDAYYPGWRARVDGQPAAIFPVDILFRGITLGPGPHEVTLYYAPASVMLGGAVSLATTLLAGGAGIWAFRRGRRG